MLPVSAHLNSQELEPRAYAALPKNISFAAFAYGLSSGNVLSDPSSPINGLKITSHNGLAAYGHTFGVFGKLARVQATLPYVYIIGSAKLNGVDTTATRSGFGDARIRLGINLTGTPVLDKKDFVKFTQKTVVGVSLVTQLPTGQYLEDKLINIGSNRWAFKPEVGVSKRFKHVYAECYAGVWFFTTNTKFLKNKIRKQEPVVNIQAHTSYVFKNKMWVSLNGTWFDGGKTTVNDETVGDLLDNWRVGATWSVPVAKKHSLKLQFHVGAFTASGYDYDMVILMYQYLW